MTTYFYKNNKKVNFNPEKRQAIVGDILRKFQQFYPDLDTSKREAVEILQDLFFSYNK